jgi:hypothetical protein
LARKFHVKHWLPIRIHRRRGRPGPGATSNSDSAFPRASSMDVSRETTPAGSSKLGQRCCSLAAAAPQEPPAWRAPAGPRAAPGVFVPDADLSVTKSSAVRRCANQRAVNSSVKFSVLDPRAMARAERAEASDSGALSGGRVSWGGRGWCRRIEVRAAIPSAGPSNVALSGSGSGGRPDPRRQVQARRFACRGTLCRLAAIGHSRRALGARSRTGTALSAASPSRLVGQQSGR